MKQVSTNIRSQDSYINDDGNKPKRIDNINEITETPKSPTIKWCDMEWEPIYPSSKKKAKKGSNITTNQTPRYRYKTKRIIQLDAIYNKRKTNPNHKFRDLYEIIYREDILNLSLKHLTNKIKINKSSCKKELISVLQKNLRTQKYIPKTIKTHSTSFSRKSHLFKIPRFEDKIVQTALRWVLQAIWEPKFRKHSFGFRPNLNCQNALYYIKQQFKGVDFWFKGNFSSCFTHIDHHLFQRKIETHVSDSKFINLYWILIKIEKFQEFNLPLSGIIQRDGVFPTIMNIFLDDFDKQIENLIKEIKDSKTKHKVGLTWRNVKRQIDRIKSVNEDIILLPTQQIENQYYITSHYKIVYVRYAEDFLVGLTGPIDFCQRTISKIKNLIHVILKLNLNKNKTFFYPANKCVKFLGVLIKSNHNTITKRKIIIKNQNQILPLHNQNIIFYAPIEDIKNKLAQLGYCYPGKNQRAKACLWLYHINHVHIIKFINSVFHNINDYYKFVNNRKILIWIIRDILWSSLVLIIRRKYKLPRIKQVVKKFGITLNHNLCGKKAIIKINTSFKNKPLIFIRKKKQKRSQWPAKSKTS